MNPNLQKEKMQREVAATKKKKTTDKVPVENWRE